MTSSRRFLEKTPVELEQFLLHAARHTRAPAAARERALSQVAASVTIGVVSAKSLAGHTTTTTTTSHWLTAKWFAIGLGASLSTLATVEQLERPRGSEPSASARPRIPPTAFEPAAARSAMAAEVRPSTAVGGGLVPPFALDAPPARDVRTQPESGVQPNSVPPFESASPRPSSQGFETPNVEQLSREVALLQRARQALATGDSAQARRVLGEYRRNFNIGVLAAEAAALEIEVAFASGERERARALSEVFLRDHATSPLSARVRALRQTDSKP